MEKRVSSNNLSAASAAKHHLEKSIAAKAATDLSATPLSDCIFRARKVMVIPPLVRLLMPVSFASDVKFGLSAKCNILTAAPVDWSSLSRPQLPFGIDEKALEAE